MKIGEKNVGDVDKAVRVVVALAAFYAFGTGMVGAPLSYIVALVGIAMMGTAIFGTCGLYSILGINTCKLPKK
jgi:hypothetical protein